jgi:hypothetical protein
MAAGAVRAVGVVVRRWHVLEAPTGELPADGAVAAEAAASFVRRN